jgi:predicted transposase YdaD
MMELFDDDYIMDAFLKSERNEAEQKGREAGRQEGREAGRQEGRQEGMQAGMQKGMIETCKEFGISFIDTVKKFADKFGLTEESSRAEVEKYWYSA